MPSTAFIQLARAGDIASILPVMRHKALQGRDVACYVHPDFAGIFDAVSYVRPVPRPTTHRDVANTAAQARADGFDEVIACQVNGNEMPAPAGCPNFITEQWARCGAEYLPLFHQLPLSFDRRDFEAEADVLRKHLTARNGKPLLVYSLNGHSSPFAKRQPFAEWLRCFERQYQLLDLTELRLGSVVHLLPLIEQAAVLIASDSLPLHLGYAFRTPTIALHRSDAPPSNRRTEWYWSEPREHWIERMTYAQTETPDGRRRIALALEGKRFSPGQFVRRPETLTRDRITHVIDWFLPERQRDRNRILAARRTWEHLARTDKDYTLVFHEMPRHALRTSRDIGDTRTLPYVRDLIDFAAERAGAGDGIVLFSNADNCLVPESLDIVRERMKGGPCCFSRRVDVASAERPMSRSELWSRPIHPGADLFAFRASWWREHREEFPDLLTACEGWDFVYRHAMLRHWPGAEISPPVVYHEDHRAYWVDHHDNAGQKHNRRLCAEWARANGMAHALNDGNSPYLFKAFGTY